MAQVELASEGTHDRSSTITRRLAAIAFADVAGFSRLMALDEVETVRRWRELRSQIMEPHMVRHGGRVAEIAGDAVLVEFPSAVNAVRWAVDVQRSLQSQASEPDSSAVRVRIGINVEDVIDDDRILQGDGITDEIVTGLSRSRSLYVIARSSTLRYRDRQKDSRQIASELDVRYILDGSVRRQGTRLRINTELIDVAGNRPIWAERFDGST